MTKTNFSSRWWLEVTRSCERESASRRRASAASARPSISLAMLLMLVPVWLVLIPSTLHANTITVNTTADPGTSKECSLRAAITNANAESSGPSTCAAGTGTDTIVFSVSGTIKLGSTLPEVENTLTIDGIGKTITVSGAGHHLVLLVTLDATLTLNNLTIAHGNNSDSDGGGIENQGTLTVTNSTFSDNGAGVGGGIYNGSLGTLSVTNSTFADNSAKLGGGIFNSISAAVSKGVATLTVTNSTFSGDNAGEDGGAIYNEGPATVINSTFAGNSVLNGFGGGIYNSGTLSVTNSTFANNSPTEGGGAIYNDGGVTVANSILAKSTAGGNCFGTITNDGYNISDDATCSFGSSTAANGDTIGDDVTDAHLALGGLANNGGPTETIALGSRSYAIDAIPIADCPPTDQRGAPRPDPASPAETACDIGAFESGNLVWLEPPTLDFGTIAIGQSSLPSAVTLINRSEKTLTKIASSIGPDYTVVSYTCSSALAAGQSCEFWVIFRPQGSVTTPETFLVFDSAPNSPQQVQLQGTTPSPPS